MALLPMSVFLEDGNNKNLDKESKAVIVDLCLSGMST
jgi:hypothetical protein